MLKIRSYYLLAPMAFSLIYAEGVLAAPLSNMPVKDVAVHHVRLDGISFDKTHTTIFNQIDKLCRAMGKEPEPLPAGEKVFSQARDIYYARGGATTHIHTKTFSIHPQNCKLQRDERLEIEIRTASGICKITPKRKRAVGWCDIQPLLTGKTMAAVESLSIKPTGKTRTIAGLKCSVYKGTISRLNIEYCIAQAGSFTGIPDFGHAHHPGLLLKTATWMDSRPDDKPTDFEATHVATDIKVGLDVLAPHISGGYHIIDSGNEE